MKSVWFDAEIIAAVKNVENEIIEGACQIITQEAKDSMVEGSYKRSLSKKGDGSYHWSSTPGTPPAPDTEALKDSVSYATSGGKTGGIGPNSEVDNIDAPVYGANTNMTVGRIGTKDIVGLWQELGTRINQGKRPFLRPALYKKEKEILDLASKHKI